MNLNECFEKRLLRRTRPDRLKSKKALEMADRAIQTAGKLMENKFYEQTILYSYTAMFQAARALLFKDGVIEKSHYCAIEYLKHNYLQTHKLKQSHLQWLDTYRIERHQTLYGLEAIEIEEKDALTAISAANEFIEAIQELTTKEK